MIFINIYMFESLNKDYYYLEEDFYFTEAEKKFVLTGMFTLSTYGKLLQCNELNRGHPKFFSQSQDEFRTKESEFVHFGLTGN